MGNQYTSYVEWPDDRIVTTLVRTRHLSVEAVPYWYPFLGELPYRGYFDRAKAEAEADRLRVEEQYDVCVSGVSAYSTLGWIDDPVTSPMLVRGGPSLVETLLHELVHATAFLDDAPEFNESVAQFIGQEAAARFFSLGEPPGWPAQATVPWPSSTRVRSTIDDRRQIAEATIAYREELRALEAEAARDLASHAARVEAAQAAARARLAALPLEVLDPARIAEKTRLDNACLALRGTYVRDLPRHAEVLAGLGGDLAAMIERLREVARSDGTPEDFYAVADPVDGIDRASEIGPARPNARLASDQLDDAL